MKVLSDDVVSRQTDDWSNNLNRAASLRLTPDETSWWFYNVTVSASLIFLITLSESAMLRRLSSLSLYFLIDWTSNAERSSSIFPLNSEERHQSDWFHTTSRLINRGSILIRSRGWGPLKSSQSWVVPKPESRDPPVVLQRFQKGLQWNEE